jgi:hypothetical protein
MQIDRKAKGWLGWERRKLKPFDGAAIKCNTSNCTEGLQLMEVT